MNHPRARILLVTRNLPPLVGGMERLNWHMAEELGKVADVRVVGPEGSAALAPPGIEVREAPLRPLWKFLWRSRWLVRNEARHWKPDIVLAGSGLTAPIARSAARICDARTAVYVHGLDVAVRHAAYRALWLSAIRRADRIIVNSHATAALCREIGVDSARIGIVHPGVDLPAETSSFRLPSQAAAEAGSLSFTGRRSRETREDADFRQQLGFGERPLLLSVGRLSARKGLREFVTHALPWIATTHPDIMLLIVGETPSQALHAEAQTPESIQAAADAAGVSDNVCFLGKVTDDDLSELYCAADAQIFPIRAIVGDPEGFGMVAVEAAAHGLPTVAFSVGGVRDAVAEGQSGYLVVPDDYAAFAETVVKTLKERESFRDSCVNFARCFAWPVFGSRLAEQLAKIDDSLPLS